MELISYIPIKNVYSNIKRIDGDEEDVSGVRAVYTEVNG
jgi:hypothetical protein